MGLKDRLAVLNRQFREIEIFSRDGEAKEVGYYRRPTEVEDDTLNKAMAAEVDILIKEQKTPSVDGGRSMYDALKEMFETNDKEIAVNTLIQAQVDLIRLQSKRELGKEEPTDETSEEDRKDYFDLLTPIFERRAEELREVFREEPIEDLAAKAAQARVERIARDKAWEIYRHRLISMCLFEKNEADGKFILTFEDHTEVPELLDTDTINTLTKAITDEVNRVKALPLK